jgi:hypothetical protein
MDEPVYIAAPRGSFHHARDITGTMIACWDAELLVNGDRAAGVPYADEWWELRLGRPFSACHLSLGDTSVEPAPPDWW